MERQRIKYIATLITEDPDIFMEVDASMNTSMDSNPAGADLASDIGPQQEEQGDKPLDELEIQKQADEIAGDDAGDADRQIADQLKAQQNAEQEMMQQRREMLEPEMDKLDSGMNALQTGVTQGRAQAADAGEAFNGLDQEMAELKAVIANVGKSLY